MAEWSSLRTPGVAGDANLTNQLRNNLCAFLDWSCLGLGYFLNATTGTQRPPYGYSPSKLRPSDDIRYASGIAWDGLKTDWVWEQGIEFSSQPISISGVYVNGIFSTSGYDINYPLGRVIFHSPVSVTSNVQVEYSFKYYNVYPDTVPWFQQLTQGTWRLDDPQATSQNSGIWSIFPDSRSQLPAVVVEVSPSLDYAPIGLGGGQWISKDVLIHVVGEDDFDVNNLVDTLSFQWQKTMFLYDQNKVSQAQMFPLSAYGYLVNPNSTYPYLVNNYLWRYFYIDKVAVTLSDNNPQSIYHGVCRWTCKVYMADII